MSAQPVNFAPPTKSAEWHLTRIASFPRVRTLTWAGEVLYVSRGYTVLRCRPSADAINWEFVGRFDPVWWRKLSSSVRLSYRLCRDGFHATAVLSAGHIVAAVPGAIVTLCSGETSFHVTHKVLRGTRPLHITGTPDGRLFWGEYFDNPDRDEVHIYASTDRGGRWDVAHTFPRGSIRHVHNIVYDEWENCLWILTGDNGDECRILRASCDLRTVDTILSGNQQARSVALIPTPDALYFSSDTPLESNHIYRLDRKRNLLELADLGSSSIYACRAAETMFFSTMVEPSLANSDRHVRLYGSVDGFHWQGVFQWKKDRWPMKLFQYGSAFLPDGRNSTDVLALTTIGVTDADLETALFRVTTGR
jgi:hypothetical protein